jgi:hypothetical protein
MIDNIVYRELQKESKKLRNQLRAEHGLAPIGNHRLPLRHVAVVLLMAMIFGCWAMDSLHYSIVPRDIHDAVTDYTDPLTDTLHDARLVPGASQTVAHNPLDGSPITAGSVLLLGVICTLGITCGRGRGEFKEAA